MLQRTRSLAALAIFVLATSAAASSHREAPAIATDPTLDATDLYAFVSPDEPDTVTLIANYIPLEAPYGGPNFFGFADWPSAQDAIHIDNNGDAVEDRTFLFQVRSETANDKTFLYNTAPVKAAAGAKQPYPGLNVYQYCRTTGSSWSGAPRERARRTRSCWADATRTRARRRTTSRASTPTRSRCRCRSLC
jgi:uncharacterized protein DUF4331